MSLLDGYRKEIEHIRDTEFPQLKGSTYVEHCGATLFAKSQIEAYQSELLSNLYGNPHSRSQSSTLSTEVTDNIRYRVLRHFNTTDDEYSVIFTSNCTGALKLIAEHFNFNNQSNEERPEGSQVTDNRKYGCFCYLLDNHTSVQGMRGAIQDEVCSILCLDEKDLETQEISKSGVIFQQPNKYESGNCLFAFPAQSNFSGRKYPLSWVERLRRSEFPFQNQFPGRWYSVLDAAAYVSTSPLDLDLHKPDFVTLSFYKMMGFPTSLGCLLVRNEVGHLLQKKYFGGGSVSASSATDMYAQFRKSLSDRFEDGTIPFLEIMSLRHGFDTLERLGGGMRAISSHTFSLSRYFYHLLSRLTHGNGQSLAVIYSGTDYTNGDTQGAVVNFNLRRTNGDYIGFAEVDKMAQLYNIHLRTGCFCNIGSCQKYLGLTSQQIKNNFQAGHVCGDDRDVINGKPTGSVRVSFGYMSTVQDVHQCLRFITECFLEGASLKQDYHTFIQSLCEDITSHRDVCDKLDEKAQENDDGKSVVFSHLTSNHSYQIEKIEKQPIEQRANVQVPNLIASHQKSVAMETESVILSCDKDTRFLTDICIYPVKSCAAFKVSSWEIGPTGLLYDRRWMVVSHLGVAISQKREPLMCMIKPKLDLMSHTLTLTYKDMEPLTLPIDVDITGDVRRNDSTAVCSSKVCGDRIQGIDCGEKAAEWLSQALQRPGCRLIQQDTASHRKTKLADSGVNTKDSVHQSISLANESQYLLVTRSSMEKLKQKIQEGTCNGQQGQEDVELENLINRFRGNLVIGGGCPLEEDSWSEIQIGAHNFMSQGGCSRCQMICLDQENGTRSKEPLRTLAVWRGRKVTFGIHIRNKEYIKGTLLRIGDPVHVIRTNSEQ